MVAMVLFPSDFNLYDTAKPPASSAAELIFLPEESRSRLLLQPSLALLRLSEADEAAKFEFMTVGILALQGFRLKNLGLSVEFDQRVARSMAPRW